MAVALKRFRRGRWLAVALSVFGLLVIAWHLSRPKTNPRHVGKWAFQIEETAWPIPIYEFGADGIGTIWSPTDQENRSYVVESSIEWSSEQKRVTWWRAPYTPRSRLVVLFDRIRWRFGYRGRVATQFNQYELVAVETDEIQVNIIRPNGTKSPATFRRMK